MTSPYYPAQPERGAQQVHTVTPPPQDDTLVQDIAEVLLASASLQAAVAGVGVLLKPFGIGPQAVQAALGLSSGGTSPRPNGKLARHGLSGHSETTIDVRNREVYYRAAYVMNSAHRIQRSLNAGEPMRVAISQESPHYRQHEAARKGRLDAVANVQRAANVYGAVDDRGTLLGWYLNPLKRNEAECIAANGHNFYAEEGTVIGLPGSVHANCGCYPGPAHDQAELVNDVLSNVVRFGRSKKLHKLRSVHTA